MTEIADLWWVVGLLGVMLVVDGICRLVNLQRVINEQAKKEKQEQKCRICSHAPEDHTADSFCYCCNREAAYMKGKKS